MPFKLKYRRSNFFIEIYFIIIPEAILLITFKSFPSKYSIGSFDELNSNNYPKNLLKFAAINIFSVKSSNLFFFIESTIEFVI